jgi:hypothetical protein
MSATARIRKPPAELLKRHLCREYLGKAENAAPTQSAFIYLTLFSGRPYAEVLHQGPPVPAFLARRSLPASIHLYDVAECSFTLELRNIPISVAVETFIARVGGETDNGQMHTTVRLKLRPSDGPLLRTFADLVRRVPRAGRIDRFARAGSQPIMVYQALRKFASVLDGFDPGATQESAATVVCGQEWDSMAK